jgi:hypothetical protein
MAHCVAVADGNLTTAATWGVVETVSLNVSNNTGVTALTTGNLDSAAFIPGANALIGVCVRLAVRASGAPTNTMTIRLRNSTTATDIESVTVNVSDLPASSSGTVSAGGWHFMRFNASHTPNGTDSYVIRATLSATTTAVSLATNGTANNWQRILVRDTTAAPAAGDDMHVPQQFNGSSNPATLTARTVTMDSTAATDYGSADTNNYVAALDISKGSTLTWATTAATNFLLRLSGHLKIYSGGTMNMGTVATPCPRGSTHILEFDCAADWAFYLSVMNGGTFNGQGLSRTSGKDVTKALTAAAIAATDTTVNIDADTGWLSGDEVYIATSNRTVGSSESKVLNGNAGASSFAVTVAMANAHPFSSAEGIAAEVVLFTRSVLIRSVSSSFMTALVVRPTGNVDCDWVAFQYCGATGGQGDSGIVIQTTTGTVAFHFCSLKDADEAALTLTGIVTTGGSVTIADFVAMRCGVSSAASVFRLAVNPDAEGLVAVSDVWIVHVLSVSAGFYLSACPNIAFSGEFRVAGVANNGINIDGNWNNQTLGGNWTSHTNAADGVANPGTWSNCYIAGDWKSWRNAGGYGFRANVAWINLRFLGAVLCHGNTDAGLKIDVSFDITRISFANLQCYGDTGFAQQYGIDSTGGHIFDLFIAYGLFGVASGLWTTHGTADVHHLGILQGIFRAQFGSATEFSPTAVAEWLTRRQVQRIGSTGHYTNTLFGVVAYETTTVQDAPGIKVTPLHATQKIDTAALVRGRGFLVGVLSGAAIQVSVYVRKNAAYNGNAPRLIQKSNSPVGVLADVVLDTLSVGADTWEILTGTTAAATADGVVEFVVDCDGTAGAVFVNQWTSDSATPSGDETAWYDGLPVRARGISVVGGGGAVEVAYGFIG